METAISYRVSHSTLPLSLSVSGKAANGYRDAEGQELVVSGPELAALKADPMLVVTEIAVPEVARNADDGPAAPEEPDNAAPQGDMPEGEDAPEGDMPEGEVAPEGDMPEGEAHA